MQGWVFTQRGPPAAVLRMRTDIPRPQKSELLPDEVLVKITHAGLFQGTAKLMAQLPHLNANLWIPEFDYSGVVEAVGSSVTDLAPGDAVFGASDPKQYLTDKRHNGVLVEYAILPLEAVVKMPDCFSLEGAAGLSANGCTAFQLADVAQVQPGMKVLITGGSSGLGGMAIQVFKAIVGEEGSVWTTCSAANTALVESLGADGVIDYTKHPKLHQHLIDEHSSRPFDVIIDVAGGDDLLYDRCSQYLKEAGVFVFAGKIKATHDGGLPQMLYFIGSYYLKRMWPVWLGGTPRRCTFYSANMTRVSLQKIADLGQAGKLKALVDSVWDMEQVLQGYARVGTSRARGKVIVHIQDP